MVLVASISLCVVAALGLCCFIAAGRVLLLSVISFVVFLDGRCVSDTARGPLDEGYE